MSWKLGQGKWTPYTKVCKSKVVIIMPSLKDHTLPQKRSYLIGWQCVMGSWVCLELVIVAAFLQKDGCLPVVKPPKLASVGFWQMATEAFSGVWDRLAHVARFIDVVIFWVICNANPQINPIHFPSVVYKVTVWVTKTSPNGFCGHKAPCFLPFTETRMSELV